MKIKEIVLILINKGILNFLPDKQFLKVVYRLRMGKKLNLKNPQTFTEKLQWLKLYNRKPEYTKMVDKYEVRNYIKEKLGADAEKYLIPLIGVYDSLNDINFDELPNQFVIKCTHDSGSVFICKEKSKLEIKKLRKKISKCLKFNYYYLGREGPYKDVKPRIIIEKYMEDESKQELKDYKVFCFNSKAKYIQVDFNRFNEHKKNIYDTDWNLTDIQFNYLSDRNKQIEKPNKLEKMIELAETLAEDIPFVRIDFYSIIDKIYIGEITFFPASGCGKFIPEKYDKIFGDMIKL